MTNINNYIEEQGGILSGQLAKYLVNTYKISDTTARKRIERLKSPIHKLKGIFADNQSFIYHSNNYNSPEYFDKLGGTFEDSAKRCFAIITAINYNHGIILKTDLPNYTFSPTSKIKGHVLYSTLIEKLQKANVLLDYDNEHFSLNSYISKNAEPNFRHYKAIQFVKDLLINQFTNWSKNIGLCSFNTAQTNKEVGGFQFSFASPTYINGFVQYKDSVPKPGFVVADVLIGNSTSMHQIDFFVQKVDAIRASNPSLKLFPVLLLDGVEINALNKLKKTGILIATVKELFGESYNELLKNLINTITNAGVILKKDPESYINLMAQLTKLINGKTNNLRGDLFELAVGYYYGKQCQSLDIGKKVRIENDPKTREIDVLAIYENEIRIVECKGYNYPIDLEYVEKYLSETIPILRKWLERFYPNKKHIFEILDNAKLSTKKYSINFFDRNQILEKAKQLNSTKFTEIMKDYYLKEIV